MNLPDIPLLDILRTRMSWLSARQAAISQNVANADTPGFTARDLKPLDFESLVKHATSSGEFSPSLMTTNPRHMAIGGGGVSNFADMDSPDTAASPTGNTVSLEEEMIKVADTQAQYQAAANLYSKAVNLLRTAIGR